jgi:hypothetical protein
MWFNLATTRYPISEQERREKTIINRDTAASVMTPSRIAKAKKLVREWMPMMER